MMRGGHLDICVLGAFQVSQHGDLANWHTGAPDAIPAVGGAMDLAVGAKQVLVTMEHRGRDGTPKVLRQCTYPLTGKGVVTRIYTDLAVIDVTPGGLNVYAMKAGVTAAFLRSVTEAPLHFPATPRVIVLDPAGTPRYACRGASAFGQRRPPDDPFASDRRVARRPVPGCCRSRPGLPRQAHHLADPVSAGRQRRYAGPAAGRGTAEEVGSAGRAGIQAGRGRRHRVRATGARQA
ncbi:hypothetical protein G6F63_013821 [Rhizopus arrhizus]|nr:hypothetical protein G6F63_013821 [Rhizopus arrhizus]